MLIISLIKTSARRASVYARSELTGIHSCCSLWPRRYRAASMPNATTDRTTISVEKMIRNISSTAIMYAAVQMEAAAACSQGQVKALWLYKSQLAKVDHKASSHASYRFRSVTTSRTRRCRYSLRVGSANFSRQPDRRNLCGVIGGCLQCFTNLQYHARKLGLRRSAGGGRVKCLF